MTTNPERAQIAALAIETMGKIAESLPGLADRVASLAGLEIDETSRQSLETALEDYKRTLEEVGETIDQIALEDKLTGQILRAGFDEITRKVSAIQLPPRPEEIPDALEQARQVIELAMSEASRSIDEVMSGILPSFFDTMSREYRDSTEHSGATQIVGLKIHIPQQMRHDPRGVSVAVEVSHLAEIDNRAIADLLDSDEHAKALADHFDGQAVALVQHGTGRPVDDDSSTFDVFTVTIIHPTGIDAYIETRAEGSTEWQIDEQPDRLSVMDEPTRHKIAAGDFGRMPASLAHFFARYIEATAAKRN